MILRAAFRAFCSGSFGVHAELMALENVTLLPHLGTACLEVREAMGMMAVDNLVAWAEGRALPNAV